jgi:hypothetical protein
MISLADFIFNKFKGELSKYIPSILYLLYDDDIVTEEFWTKYAIKMSLPSYFSRFQNDEVEGKFLEAAGDFTHWIE